MLCYGTFALIRSTFIDYYTCPRVLLQTVCGMYTNWTFGFTRPSGLRKIMARVWVGHAYLPSAIDALLFTKGGEGGVHWH